MTVSARIFYVARRNDFNQTDILFINWADKKKHKMKKLARKIFILAGMGFAI